MTKLVAGRRLVTITGPGGSGKTRLALELVAQLPAGGLNLTVDLAPLSSAEMVPAQVAAAAGIVEQPGEQLLETIGHRLPGAPMLMVLDNCEHVLSGAAEVAQHLLRRCEHLTILATSRQPLGVPGEVSWSIPPLGLPEDADADAGTLLRFDAVRLFADRAGSRKAGYELSEESAPVVAGICRRLDGMPLAIELASAWVGVLGESEILERVSADLRLLGAAGRSVPERHGTMEAAIEWSAGLLHPDERRVFRSLSVFSGSFSLEAAEAVTSDHDVLPAISALVAQSLVVAETAAQRPTRYRLLETIRRFGRAELEAHPEHRTVRDRHAGYLLSIAEQAEAVRDTRAAVEAMARLIEYRDDLRAALEWLAAEDPDRAVQLAGALGWFWQSVSPNEGLAWMARILDRPATRDRMRARAEDWAGWLAIKCNNYRLAEARLRSSYAVSEAIGDDAGIARALTGLGPIVRLAGNVEESRRMVENALVLARRSGDGRVEGGALTTLGIFAVDDSDLDAAVRLLEEGLHVHRRSENLGALGYTLVFLAVALHRSSADSRALELARDALDAFEGVADLGGMAMTLEVMGMVGASLDPAIRVRLTTAGNALMEREGLGRPPFWLEDLNAWRAEWDSRLGSRAGEVERQGTSMTLAQALRLARTGDVPVEPEEWSKLSRREQEVAPLVAEGLSNREIAERLFISERTVESHVGSMLRKLGLRSRVQIAAWASRPG